MEMHQAAAPIKPSQTRPAHVYGKAQNTARLSVVNTFIGLKIHRPHDGKIYIVGYQMNMVDQIKAN